MKRRDFISLLGSTAAWWPVASRAQQATTIPVIGFVHIRSAEDSAAQLAAFHRGLAENGYVEGQNLAIEYKWGLGHYDRMPALAGELVRQQVKVILAGAEPSVLAAKAATSTIPIVFVVGSDPRKLGAVASYNSPGGNATGVLIFTATLDVKRLGLLHDLIPSAKRFGVLVNPKFPYVQDQIPALVVAADPFFDTRADQLIALAAQRKVPVMYQFRQYPAAGGLISYGPDLPDAYREAGIYVGRVLKGAKPTELPVVQESKFEF